MNEEQIKDIFEQELEKIAQKGGHFSRFGNEFTDYKGYLDCDYELGETAMLATIKRVLDAQTYTECASCGNLIPNNI